MGHRMRAQRASLFGLLLLGASVLTGCGQVSFSDEVDVDYSGAAPFQLSVSACAPLAANAEFRDDTDPPTSISVAFDSAEQLPTLNDYKATGHTVVDSTRYEWSCEANYETRDKSLTARLTSFTRTS